LNRVGSAYSTMPIRGSWPVGSSGQKHSHQFLGELL
jgi:hypothetical protein